jgi:hypothetical protein
VSLLLLALLIGGFGYLTVKRSAYSKERMTDFGVYTRAAWAVRVGINPYDVVDDRNWHYTYPPPFVLLMTPLADPPVGADRSGYLPFGVSVAIWYGLNVVFAAFAVHLLALAVLPDARPFTRRWWYARLIPFDVCLLPIGYTLGRGQVNVLVLLMMAISFWGAVRRRSFVSGVWLAAAACVKVIPGLLVLFPLTRRRWREFLGVVAGAVLFLFVIPAAVWGPQGAIQMNEAFVKEVVFPGLTNQGSKSREQELIGTTRTDSQAFHAVIHAIRHPDRDTRPINSDGVSKVIHYLIGLGMVGVTVWVFRPPLSWMRGGSTATPLTINPSPPRGEGSKWLLYFGCLGIIMIHLAPASHMHFYSFALPLVCGLVSENLQQHPERATPTPLVLAGLIAWTLLTTIPLFDTDEVKKVTLMLRDFGIAVWATVGLWVWGIVRLSACSEPR